MFYLLNMVIFHAHVKLPEIQKVCLTLQHPQACGGLFFFVWFNPRQDVGLGQSWVYWYGPSMIFNDISLHSVNIRKPYIRPFRTRYKTT